MAFRMQLGFQHPPAAIEGGFRSVARAEECRSDIAEFQHLIRIDQPTADLMHMVLP